MPLARRSASEPIGRYERARRTTTPHPTRRGGGPTLFRAACYATRDTERQRRPDAQCTANPIEGLLLILLASSSNLLLLLATAIVQIDLSDRGHVDHKAIPREPLQVE